MFAAVLVLHILVSILLILIVLLQAGRGAELGAAFGSVGQATFSRGSTTFMSKFTTGLAVIFMVTSLSLAFMSTERPGQSILSDTASQTLPAQRADSPDAGLQETSSPMQQADAPPPGMPGAAVPLEQTDAPPRQSR